MKKLILPILLVLGISMLLGVVSAETVSLKGLVINHLGNQVDNAKIFYQLDGKESSPIYSNSNGAYTIEVPLSTTPIYLEFSKENYRSEALVIYQQEGKIIVEDQSFDRCFPRDNSGKSLPGAKPNKWEFQTKEEALQTELNTFLYPFSNVYVYWDTPVTAFVNYNQKTCPIPGNPGNSNLKTEHVLGMALPLSYDATLILTTEGNKKETIQISNSEFGKHIKVYKKNGEIKTEICSGESCNMPKESFFVKYLYYIVGGIILLILIIIILVLIFRRKKSSSIIGQ